MSDAKSAPNPAAFEEFDMADRLKRSLRVSGISVHEMADYLEMSRESVGTWINGRVMPRKTTIMAWALKTGAPFEWLWDGVRSGSGDTPSPVGGASVTETESGVTWLYQYSGAVVPIRANLDSPSEVEKSVAAA